MQVTGTILFIFCLTGTLAGIERKNETQSEITNEKTEVATPEENSTTPSSGDDPSPTRSPSEVQRCKDLTGIFMDGKFEGLEVQHDLAKILEEHGRPPGKVNATWAEKEDAPVETADLEKRPLPDADQKYWLYKYGDTDGETYIRIEHAVKRFSGTPKAFTEIRGLVYFTPDDYCGTSRKADYTVDDRGFTFEVSREYCGIGQLMVTCAWPTQCKTHENGRIPVTCVGAANIALLAALVGAGNDLTTTVI